MAKLRLYFTFLVFFFLNACFPQEHLLQKTFIDESNVIIYLQPMPQEASRLRFTIEKISAIRDDGLQIPLLLAFNELKRADIGGLQRRLASGHLPEGSYTGISIKITKALLQGEEGESALLVPEEPVVVEQMFKLAPRRALTLFLSFNASGAIAADGVRFTPGFTIAPSRRGLVSFTGYVSNFDSNSITVYNKKTMQVVNVIPTGRNPKGMVLDQLRGRAYVAASGDDAVEIIDILKGKIVGRIKLNFQDEPVDLALTADGKTLVSVNRGSNTVSIIDPLTQFEITKIRVGEGPVSAVIDPLGFKAYIMNSLSNTFSVVDLTQKVFSVSIAVEGAPIRGAFSRSGDKLYIISRDSPHLTVVDPSRLIVTDRIFMGTRAASIKVDIQTDLIYVGRAGGEISVIAPFSLMFIDTITVEGHAAFMTIDGDENSLFVVLPDRKILQKVNLTSKKAIGEIEVDEGAYAVVVMGER
jgi:YVTN family beta-propeller protein